MDESPKFLVSIGQDAQAVQVIHRIAKRNGVTSSLTVKDLRLAAAPYLEGVATPAPRQKASNSEEEEDVDDEHDMLTAFSTWQLVKNSFSDINGEHTKGLFATPRLAYSTTLIVFIYGALGLAYPLYKSVLPSFLSLSESAKV